MLAVSSAGLAMTAHALAGGGMPDTALTLLLTALVGWTGAALADRTRGVFGLLAVLGVAQLGMHLVLSSLMSHQTAPGTGMYLAHAGATVLTGLLLAHAESMLQAAVAGLRLLLPVLRGPLPVPPGPVPVPLPAPGDTPLVSVVFRRVHGRRGPPVRS
ncbi:hypothetical protein [Amycolatopsis cynarae]